MVPPPRFSLTAPGQLDDQTDEDIYLAIRLLRKDETGKIKEKDYAVIQLRSENSGASSNCPNRKERLILCFSMTSSVTACR